MNRAAALGLTLVAAILAACEAVIDPYGSAPTNAAVQISVEPARATELDSLLMRINRLAVGLRGDHVSRDTIVSVAIVGANLKARLMLDASEIGGDITVTVEARHNEFGLFRGSGVIHTDGTSLPSATIRVRPIVERIVLDLGTREIRFDALGESRALPPGLIFLKTDLLLQGAALIWTTRDPRVAEVVSGRTLVSRGNGETELVGRYETFADSVTVRVNQVPATAVSILPADTTAGIGELVQYRLNARDKNGNPIVGAALDWSFDPAGPLALNATGAGITRCLGTGEIRVTGGGRARINVTAALVPVPDLIWEFNDGLRAGDLAGRSPTPANAVEGGHSPTRRPGSNQVAFVWRDTLRVTELYSGGEPRKLVLPQGRRVHGAPEFTADGAFIYFETEDGVSRIRPDGSGFQTLGYEFPAQNPTTSPDGSRFAYAASSQLVVQVGSRDPERIWERPGVISPSWSPDGQTIAFVDNEGVWLIRPDGTGARKVAPRVTDRRISWSPDGKRLVAFSNEGMVVIHIDAALWETLCWNTSRNTSFALPAVAWWR